MALLMHIVWNTQNMDLAAYSNKICIYSTFFLGYWYYFFNKKKYKISIHSGDPETNFRDIRRRKTTLIYISYAL
jgi:hypothetical protein